MGAVVAKESTELGLEGATRDLHRHFIHKGRSMKESSKEIPLKITRQRDRVHNQVLSNVATALEGLRPKKILDVGTGYGMSLTFLARKFERHSHIWSVDASPAIVREIRRIMRKNQHSRNVIIERARAERLPFKSGQFDLVVSLFSLHHFSNPRSGLLEMSRVLSPGGKLIVADWTPSAGKSLMLHAQSDMPSPNFVSKQLKHSGHRTKRLIRSYSYLIEATK